MKGVERKASWVGATLLAMSLGFACGEGRAVEGSAGSSSSEVISETTARELVEAHRKDPQNAAKTFMAAAREVVELPSHRRLKGFLPASLPGRPHVSFDSSHKESEGRAEATGRYQASQFDFQNGVEIQINYHGKKVFNTQEQLFQTGFGEREQISGFDAVFEEDEVLDASRFGVSVRLSPELWVEASGAGSRETVRAAAAAVDLKALAAALADGVLFQESAEDRLEQTILSVDALEQVLPLSIGTQERRGVSGFAMLESPPLHTRASGQYGTGNLTLFDYGEATIAATVELSARDLQGFANYAAGKTDDAVDQVLEVADGRGNSAILHGDKGRNTVVAVHVARGRFVGEYIGTFVPAMELDEALPAEVRNELERAQKELGAGAFASPEEQRDAVLAALGSIDLAAYDN